MFFCSVMSVFFWLFAALLLLSSLMVVVSRNPVYSVFFLIFAFVNVSGLLLLVGAELIAMVLLIVYVGAVAVLFLFVVMMLDVRVGAVGKLVPRSISGIVLMIIMLSLDVYALVKSGNLSGIGQDDVVVRREQNARSIGKVMYTDYFYAFQVVGLILLAAMVGAIALTVTPKAQRGAMKAQSVIAQMGRDSRIRKVDLR